MLPAAWLATKVSTSFSEKLGIFFSLGKDLLSFVCEAGTSFSVALWLVSTSAVSFAVVVVGVAVGSALWCSP